MDIVSARDGTSAPGGLRRVLAIVGDVGLGVLLMLAVPCVILLLFLPLAAGVRLLIGLVNRL
jgi:hypothetical protein